MYHTLDPVRISSTAVEINRRIGEQFPGSGLLAVSRTLCELAESSTQRAARLARADWRIRVPIGIAVMTMVAVAVFMLLRIRKRAITRAAVTSGLTAAWIQKNHVLT